MFLPLDGLTQFIEVLFLYVKDFSEGILPHLIISFTELPVFEHPLIHIGFHTETAPTGRIQYIAVLFPYFRQRTFEKIRRQMVIVKAGKPFPRYQQKGFQAFAAAVFQAEPFPEIPLHNGTLLSLESGIDNFHVSAVEMAGTVMTEINAVQTEGITRQTVFEKVLRLYRIRQKHIIIEIHELFR